MATKGEVTYALLSQPEGSPVGQWRYLAMEHFKRGPDHYEECLRCFQQANRIDPSHMLTLNDMAVITMLLGASLEGIVLFERALVLTEGKIAHVWANYALALEELERWEEARHAACKAIALQDLYEANWALGRALHMAQEIEAAIPLFEKCRDMEPDNMLALTNPVYLRTLIDCKPAAMAHAKAVYAAKVTPATPPPPHPNDPDLERPLRVGLVSGDFRQHSAATVFAPMIWKADPAQVEYFAYSTQLPNSIEAPYYKKFLKHFALRWRGVEGLDDAELDAQIRKDRIDVLVDLSGHTAGNRLAVFARRPAPVQVTGFGFAHGTGIPAIQYFLADPVSVPLSLREHYTETIVDLPCVVPYDPPGGSFAPSSPAPITYGPFTFGVYSRTEKLNALFLAAVGEILKRVPDSRIRFKDGHLKRPDVVRFIRDGLGVPIERIDFGLQSSQGDHFLTYQQVDLFLDPWPHSGGVAALEMLYMGVPLVTRAGPMPAGRISTSILTAIGLTEFIAKDAASWIELAVSWADHAKDLALYRPRLRDMLLTSVLCSDEYVRAVERAYREMWRRWCQEQAT